MFARWLVPLALCAVAVSSVAGARAADALADVAVDRLTRLLTVLAPNDSHAELELEEPPAIFAAAAPLTSPALVRGAKHQATAKKPASPRSLFVSAARVLSLAESGARPRGKLAAATAKRSAGLRLSGVSALGVGLLDGDVLTEAAGAPALDSGAVIEAVLRARAGHQKTISGTFYRGDERYTLVVEQPYLPAPGKVPAQP